MLLESVSGLVGYPKSILQIIHEVHHRMASTVASEWELLPESQRPVRKVLSRMGSHPGTLQSARFNHLLRRFNLPTLVTLFLKSTVCRSGLLT
jgi:hypothetical protein